MIRHRIRDARELTQAELARRVTAEGIRLTGDKVSKIESGDRAVSAEELIVLAFVLDVPPVQLLSPLDGEHPVRITPNWAIEREEVGNWMVWGPPGQRQLEARRR